ncbi:hypothetical protein B7463_g10264, partial [Scytalidium lignicola]
MLRPADPATIDRSVSWLLDSRTWDIWSAEVECMSVKARTSFGTIFTHQLLGLVGRRWDSELSVDKFLEMEVMNQNQTVRLNSSTSPSIIRKLRMNGGTTTSPPIHSEAPRSNTLSQDGDSSAQRRPSPQDRNSGAADTKARLVDSEMDLPRMDPSLDIDHDSHWSGGPGLNKTAVDVEHSGRPDPLYGFPVPGTTGDHKVISDHPTNCEYGDDLHVPISLERRNGVKTLTTPTIGTDLKLRKHTTRGRPPRRKRPKYSDAHSFTREIDMSDIEGSFAISSPYSERLIKDKNQMVALRKLQERSKLEKYCRGKETWGEYKRGVKKRVEVRKLIQELLEILERLVQCWWLFHRVIVFVENVSPVFYRDTIMLSRNDKSFPSNKENTGTRKLIQRPLESNLVVEEDRLQVDHLKAGYLKSDRLKAGRMLIIPTKLGDNP